MSKVHDNLPEYLPNACRKLFPDGPDADRVAEQFAYQLAALLPPDEWQEIQTAPKDKRILVCNCEFDPLLPAQVQWDEEQQAFVIHKFGSYKNPTHWMHVQYTF
jgi:hypothetical protein